VSAFHQRDNGGLAVSAVLIVFGALVIAYGAYAMAVRSDRCESQGGTWSCGYYDPCICLAKGTVLP
jgi:hypothetical protein